MGIFRPVPHRKISDEIVDQIVGLILRGQLKPGTPLPPERKLAGTLGVSRPPLREALKALETMGYIQVLQRRKMLVKSLTDGVFRDPLAEALEQDADLVIQLLAIRKVLEPWAASQATQRLTSQEIAQVEESFYEIERDYRADRPGVPSDARFHMTIYEGMNNTVLSHLMSTLFALLRGSQQVAKQVILKDERKREEVFQQHLAILQAIKAKNPRKAKAASVEHIDFFEQLLLGLREAGNN